MQRFLDLPNLVTLVGLWLGFASALLAGQGRLALGLLALVLAGVCDLLDGLVARRLGAGRSEEARRFGARLDSLVDACSFGAAPALILHAGWPGGPGALVGGLLLTCAVWRLAWFDTVGLSGEGTARYYTGLPTTYAALLLPVGGLLMLLGPDPLRWGLAGAGLVQAVAMVSPVQVRKPWGPWYAILLALAAGMVAVYAWIAWRGP